MKQKQNKLINYKNEEYESFVNGLNCIHFDGTSAIKQCKQVQEFIKYQERLYDKETVYTFSKRYIINNQIKDKHIDINLSLAIGAISGIISTLIINAIECIPIIANNLLVKAITSTVLAILFLIFLIPTLKKEINDIRKKGTISRINIILTVFQNYCKKAENEFDWTEAEVKNERIEETN